MGAAILFQTDVNVAVAVALWRQPFADPAGAAGTAIVASRISSAFTRCRRCRSWLSSCAGARGRGPEEVRPG
jgi:hypothetical protein